MSEESIIYSGNTSDNTNNNNSRQCATCGKAVGTHQFSDYFWLCNRCFNQRQSEKKAPYIDWTRKETVDSLIEAVHYFAELQRHRNYTDFWQSGTLQGSKGIICYRLDMSFLINSPLGVVVPGSCRYYLLYNRRYLEYGDRRFERASSMHGAWQTVHKKVIEKASLENMLGQFREHVCIVIVMQDKTIWYINPNEMKKFVFEYETEDIPFGETEPEGHIPISREKIISRNDPFIPLKKKKITESGRT